MNKIKHIFITLLLLCIGVVKGYAYSFSYDGIYYNILSTTDKTVEVTYKKINDGGYSLSDYSGDIIIPQFVVYGDVKYQVIKIGNNAFSGNDGVTRILFPEELTSIGDRAFYRCEGITSIELPEKIESIGKSAFNGCGNVTSIKLSDGLKSIGDYAFSGCSITSIKLPEGLKSIGEGAFEYCYLTSIELPEGLESIGRQAFWKCNILSVTIPASVLTFSDSAFELAKKIIFLGNTRPSGISQNFINSNMPICYVSSKANYGFGIEYANLSSMFEVGGVKYVLVSAKDRTCDIIDCAYNSSAENIVIDSLVTYRNIKLKVRNINDYAFYENDSIQSAVIKNNGYIGAYAFQGCDSVENVTLGNSVDSVFSYAFSNCTKLKEITIPNNVPYLGSHCFYTCTSLNKAIIGTGVKSLNTSTFFYCNSLAEVVMGENVARIYSSVFNGCSSLASITIPQATKDIDNSVFSGCTNLREVIIADRNDSITLGNKYYDGKYYPLFTDCKLDSVYIGGKLIYDKTAAKGYSPFNGNTYLRSVAFNDTEVAIYDSEFAGCSNLQNIVFGKGIASIGKTAFANCSSLPGIDIPNEIKSLGKRSFYNCTALKSAKIGTGINTLEWATFENCSSLTDMKIGVNVETIAKSVLRGCTSLPQINIPQATLTVSDSVFYNCTSLTNVIIEDRTTTLTLGSNGSSSSSSATSSTNPLFYSCPLDSVYIGGKIKYNTQKIYGFSPFFRNTSLRTVVVTDRETMVYDNEFYGCSGLTDVVIGDGVTSIGNWAFSGCSSLTNFAFGNSVKTIGEEAFSDCTNMVKLVSSCNEPPVCGNQALADIDIWNCTLYVPNDYIDAYYNAEQWWDFFFIEGAEYKVTFMIGGEKHSETMVKYGTQIELPTPTKEGYTFQGWKDVPETMPADNITLYGSFSPNTYTITYVVDGEVYDTCLIACDAEIVPIAAPTKYDYTFSHWANLPETMPAKDITVTAVYVDKVKEILVTVNQYGSATYCSQYALDFSEVQGLKAYAASGYNSSTGVVTLTRVMTAKAGMGLFIKGESGEYSVPVLDNTDDNSLNMLVGTLEKTTINRTSSDGLYYNYRYTIKDGESTPLFYRVNDGYSLSSGKAYLQIPIAWFASEAEAKTIKLNFDDAETTAINECNETSSDTIYYDLTGRKVSNPQKGRIYIVNGKKIMLK